MSHWKELEEPGTRPLSPGVKDMRGAARRAAHDLAEGRDLAFGIFRIQSVEDDLDLLLRGQHVQDERREGEELADALHRFDCEARDLAIVRVGSRIRDA